MLGLPKDFDTSFFVGCTLEMVCFAQYQVNLHFDQRIRVVVLGAYSESNDRVREVPVQESSLMSLVGAVVSRATPGSDGSLTLEFGTGQHLRIYDNSRHYESYSIANGDEVTIV